MPAQNTKSRRPVTRPSTSGAARSATANKTATATPNAPKTTNPAVKRDIMLNRQERLARKEELKRREQRVTAILAVAVIAVLAIIIWQVIPHTSGNNAAAPKPKACAIVPKDKISTADTMPANTGTPVDLGNGLQYIDIVTGCGDQATAGAKVTMDYTGWVQNGKQFDSSISKNQPIKVILSTDQDPTGQYFNVITGWQQGIVGMKVGGVRRIIIPGPLGYGANPPSGSGIPANATLVFDVGLDSIP